MILKELQEIEDKSQKLEFVKANKEAILKAKKKQIKWADGVSFMPQIVKGETATKADGTNESGVFEIVGNSVGFMDSHDDVSMKGSWTKTVNEGGANVPILDNHQHGPSHIFARNLGVQIKEIAVRSLGYNREGYTEAVVAKIAPIYDIKMRERYENGEIKQHSAGLQYMKIELAINDSSEGEYYNNWNKYIGQVINRDRAEEVGYFFPVLEQKLIEISAVLFGSNEFTPTLDNNKSLSQEPSVDTPAFEEPIPVLVNYWNNSKNYNHAGNNGRKNESGGFEATG